MTAIDPQLIAATRPFAAEQPARTRTNTIPSVVLLIAAFAVAAAPVPLALRIAAGVLEGLLIMRCFVLYHDFMHNTIFRGSRWLRPAFRLYGMLVLNPSSIWLSSHGYHHANVGRVLGSQVGQFMILPLETYRELRWWEKAMYRVSRHAVTIGAGYLFVFIYGMCLRSFLKRPRAHWDSGLALVLHGAGLVALARLGGIPALVLAGVVPMTIACAIGAYLFFAQHNFPGMHMIPRTAWTSARASLDAAAYIGMSRVMHWFTGNMGYHHVHHLNPQIPFYRLAETMAAVPGLQRAPQTSFAPRNIRACLRLSLWDPKRDCMVSYRGEC